MIKPQVPSLFILQISTSTLFFFFFFFFNTHFTICLGISESGSNSFANSDLDAVVVSRRCSRNTSECTGIGIEMRESEENIKRRRVLMMDDERRYISYATLKRDLVPCRRPGASYYNCRAVEDEANPYTRGCEIIAGCARTISGDDLQP